MGRLDHWSKVFFEKPVNFADAFNHSLFRGRRVVLPETLEPQNPKEVFQLLRNRKLYLERERDILKRATFKRGEHCVFVLFALEVQSFFDPTMPLRCMFYDVLNYIEQLQKLEWKLVQDGTFASRDEMLSKFPENAKLVPIIPLVVFLSDKEWPRGRRLHDLLDIPNKEIARIVNDYTLHVITPQAMTDNQILRYGREMSMVLLSAKYASDKKALQMLTNRHSRFRSMEYETARLITEITNMNTRLKKTEKVNMTQRIQSWSDYFMEQGIAQGMAQGLEQGRAQGMEQGIAQGMELGISQGRVQGLEQGKVQGAIMAMLDFHVPSEEILNRLVKKFTISKEEAQRELDKLTKPKA